MFTSPTVIILGAGSSHDYGLPLGSGLWDSIARHCEAVPGEMEAFFTTNFLDMTAAYLRRVAVTSPKTFAYVSFMPPEQGDVLAQAKLFASKVSKATRNNVDEFVQDYRSLREPMKAMIAGTLFEHMYSYDKQTRSWVLANYFALDIGGKGNWMRSFVGLCRRHLRRLRGAPPEPVIVISFNYDRLLETVLREFWSELDDDPHPFDECFIFIYPNGVFSDLPRSIQDPGPWIIGQAKNIALMGDSTSSLNRRVIAEAEQIFIAGFSCADSNMEYLGIEDKDWAKVHAQNFDTPNVGVDIGLARLLSRMRVGSDPKPLRALVDNGFFEPR